MDKASNTHNAPPQDFDIFERDADASIGGEFDFKPLEKSAFERLQERLFLLTHGKPTAKAATPAKSPKEVQQPIEVSAPNKVGGIVLGGEYPQIETSSFGPVVKKNFIEKARDQIKYPAIKSAAMAIRGLGLVIFVAGAYMIYSTVPTKPDLVIGMVLLSVAGNIILSQR